MAVPEPPALSLDLPDPEREDISTMEFLARLEEAWAVCDRFDLQIALRSPDLTPGERPPVHLTLALDNSGSMEGLGLELLRAAGLAVTALIAASPC